MPTEIIVLGWSVALLIAQMFLASIPTTMELGGEYQAGPRDEPRTARGRFAGRAGRAYRNLLETYPAFVALALALAITGKTGGYATTAAIVWLVARVLYVPLYLVQIPFARSIVWFIALLALITMLIRLLA
ncbi:MAPEG family protein [Rhodopseudomonas sp. B29]|uniref:MAPEG family protein n=1 Tax=Rhodopseudomonas sp. B29 TaxID=95607 RepID=UPI000348701D|nr:MAPEG family protein [Rhodopseudomonas sp. B29]